MVFLCIPQLLCFSLIYSLLQGYVFKTLLLMMVKKMSTVNQVSSVFFLIVS